jgi:hypothetical protein
MVPHVRSLMQDAMLLDSPEAFDVICNESSRKSKLFGHVGRESSPICVSCHVSFPCRFHTVLGKWMPVNSHLLKQLGGA